MHEKHLTQNEKQNLYLICTYILCYTSQIFLQLVENFAIRFLPNENGIYCIHVYFKNSPIPGSPFRIRVGADVGDPGMVHAYGDGLEKGQTGMYPNVWSG